jgi:hypothetical protein
MHDSHICKDHDIRLAPKLPPELKSYSSQPLLSGDQNPRMKEYDTSPVSFRRRHTIAGLDEANEMEKGKRNKSHSRKMIL